MARRNLSSLDLACNRSISDLGARPGRRRFSGCAESRRKAEKLDLITGTVQTQGI
jgi:hypothetical protein